MKNIPYNTRKLIEILDCKNLEIKDVELLLETSYLEGLLHKASSNSEHYSLIEEKMYEIIKKFKANFTLTEKDWEKEPAVVKKAKSILKFCDNDLKKSLGVVDQIKGVLGSEADTDYIEQVAEEIKEIFYNKIIA